MRVVVVGGGFAGRAAAGKVYKQLPFNSGVEVVLVDRNEFTTMLPSLPDVAGNKIKHQYVKEKISRIVPKGIKIINTQVNHVDFKTKTVHMAGDEKLAYDYLVFAPGSKANFYDSGEELKSNHTLDNLENALKIRDDYYEAMTSGEITDVVVAGGSFTGIELACTLDEFAKHIGKKITVSIVARSGRLLTMLEESTSEYTKTQLEKLGIKLLFHEKIQQVQGRKVLLKSGKTINNAFFCWCGGVKNAIEAEGKHKALEDGRILVDQYLRIPEHPEVFVVGDAAAVKNGADYIRRAVNFSEKEGTLAGSNVAAAIHGDKLKVFKPKDKGWIIPMHDSSIGKALGAGVKGHMGLCMHYVMCGLLNFNGRNKRKYVKLGLKNLVGKID